MLAPSQVQPWQRGKQRAPSAALGAAAGVKAWRRRSHPKFFALALRSLQSPQVGTSEIRALEGDVFSDYSA